MSGSKLVAEIRLDDGQARRFGALGFSPEGELLRHELADASEPATDEQLVAFLYDAVRPAIVRSLRLGGHTEPEIQQALTALQPVPPSTAMRQVIQWLGYGVKPAPPQPVEVEVTTPMGAAVVLEC